MHKFIPSNRIGNTHIFVTKYNWAIEEHLKGKAILLHINHLNDIESILKHTDEVTKFVGFIYRNDYASLETIDINPNWGHTSVILYINRLGQYRNIYPKINLMKRLNVMVVFTSNEAQAARDAQILSSLGIHSGILIMPESQLSESVLDLMTYAFYGSWPHAEIEPFATICRYYDGESYVSPAFANFENPNRYIHINKEKKCAFTSAGLKDSNKFFEESEILDSNKLVDLVEKENRKWQNYFINSHPCTFCPAFRICLSYFDFKTNGCKCKEVMSELLEAIEFHKQIESQKRIERCQP